MSKIDDIEKRLNAGDNIKIEPDGTVRDMTAAEIAAREADEQTAREKALAKSREFHPIQTHDVTRRGAAFMPSVVTLRAYEVYCHLYGPQPAMVDLEGRGCRGGFGVGELIAFLYARSFPKVEWRKRFDEALTRPPENR